MPSQALLDRTHHAVVGKIEDGIHRRHAVVGLARIGRRSGPKQAPDLRCQDELISRLRAQHRAEALLGEPVSVQRRGVEESHARLPRRLDDAVRFVVRHRLEEAAKGGGAKPEACHLELRAPEGDPVRAQKSSGGDRSSRR